MLVYLRPAATLPSDKGVAVLYTMITSMLNPLIYTLRNDQMKTAIRKMWNKKIHSVEK
jgi:olfactory receptor